MILDIRKAVMDEIKRAIDELPIEAREAFRKQQLGYNGLAPCGCGGKAVMRKYKCHSGEDVWSVMCDKCQVGTAECFRESFARNDWNNAMGVEA